jgi:hypothetical protein
MFKKAHSLSGSEPKNPPTSRKGLLRVKVHNGSRDNSVDTAMGYGLDGRGSIPERGKRFFLLHSVQTGSGANPASYPMVIAGSFPGVKRWGREADY